MAKTKKQLSSLGLKDTDSTSKTKKKIGKNTRKKSKLTSIQDIKKKKVVIKQYIHERQKRANNPPVGLVTPESDVDLPSKKYSFDPHLDPRLEWSGKIENSNFETDTVSLHRHERIDPITIIEKVLNQKNSEQQTLFPFFEQSENNLPLRDAIEFYKHEQGWSNRLIAGDSLLIMNSLLEKERMENSIQMIYIDPPYGIKFGSNFQPFVNKRDVKDGKDEDLTQEPETIKAFRDTWELGIHSYLSYLRNRLFLSEKLLTPSGSIFVQISDENLHHVKEIMDEIFGSENYVSIITFRRKINTLGSKLLGVVSDYLIWYAKDKKQIKFNRLFEKRSPQLGGTWSLIELENGDRRKLTKDEIKNPNLIPINSKIFASYKLAPAGFNKSADFLVTYNGKKYQAPHTAGGRSWKTNKEGMKTLVEKNRVLPAGDTLRFVAYYDDFPYSEIDNLWDVMKSTSNKTYAVQTSTDTIQRCMLMTTDPGDIVFDPTCGSGTTAEVAEKWGRRWITCDSSRVAITLTRSRLMTNVFNYYKTAHSEQNVSNSFEYKKASHITLGSLANNREASEEILFDQPIIDKSKIRVSGPFTVEAVPSPTVKSLDTEYKKFSEIDSSISRTIENKRQQDWRDELLNTGVRGKLGQKLEFSRIETHPTSKWIHAIAETKDSKPKIVAVSFGPEYSPLEKNQVALTISEAQKIVPKPELIIFAALQFDPEAAKDIDELQWPGVQVLRVHVNADLLTSDLKKKRASNESFWLMGQPDIELQKQTDGKYVVEVKGFDYYNSKTDEIDSGDSSKIVMWMLDTDYDERSLYPQQIFFPMSGSFDLWSKISKILKSEIDEQLILYYRGTKSLPFSPGSNNQIAVKIIDDRGIESLRIIKIE